MENLFTFGAALYSEKKKKGCLINECESFVTITFKAANVQHLSICGQTISFETDSFEVIESESHKDWKKIFHCQRTGKKVTIEVPEGYVPGFPLSKKGNQKKLTTKTISAAGLPVAFP